MKTIELIETDVVKARDVLKIVMEQAGPQGVNVEQMRRRCKVLDALDAAKNGRLTMEDAEFEFLSATVRAFPFAGANRDLLRVVDALTTPMKEEEKKP